MKRRRSQKAKPAEDFSTYSLVSYRLAQSYGALEPKVAEDLKVLSEQLVIDPYPTWSSYGTVFLVRRDPWGKEIEIRVGDIDWRIVEHSSASLAQLIHVRAQWAAQFLRAAVGRFGLRRCRSRLDRVYKGAKPPCHLFLQPRDYAWDPGGFPLEAGIFFGEDYLAIRFPKFPQGKAKCCWKSWFFRYKEQQPAAIARALSLVFCHSDAVADWPWRAGSRIAKLIELDTRKTDCEKGGRNHE